MTPRCAGPAASIASCSSTCPDVAAREAILSIHTRAWSPPLSDAMRQELAERTNGYAGADLKALCTEAALRALHRTYPADLRQ